MTGPKQFSEMTLKDFETYLFKGGEIHTFSGDLDLFYDYLLIIQKHIKNIDVTQVNAVVGFNFDTDGRFMVQYSLRSPLVFKNVEDGMQVIAEYAKKYNTSK